MKTQKKVDLKNTETTIIELSPSNFESNNCKNELNSILFPNKDCFMWFNNNLFIEGAYQDMKEFYEFLEDDIINNFFMNKLSPIPEDLFEYGLTKNSSRLNDKNEKNTVKETTVKIFNNMSEHENTERILLEKYDTIDWRDWCWDNWGCDKDICDLKINSKNESIINITYFTDSQPNHEFLKNISGKFSNLRFALTYYNINMIFAHKATYKNGEYDCQCFKVNQLLFIHENGNYLCVLDDEMDEGKPLSQITFIGEDWVKVCAEKGYTKENILNWFELNNYMK